VRKVETIIPAALIIFKPKITGALIKVCHLVAFLGTKNCGCANKNFGAKNY
jgi:hypothetical protein